MNGDLQWVTKGRFGRKQRQHAFVRTSNLSLDGAQVELNGIYPFADKARARLQLGIRYCDVRIMDVKHQRDKTILRLFFMAPNADFVALVESQLPVITTDRERFEGKWT